MAYAIQFVSNYDDQSTEKGFQFEFKCDRCNSGFRTKFKSWAIGTISTIADTAGDLFGGVFGTAREGMEHVRSAAWEKAHDKAFEEAVKEIKPEFIQCPRCSHWVCRTGCWNNKKGLCKECAPDLGVEMAAAQASRSVEEVWSHAAMAEEDKKLATEYWRENIKASCPKCEQPLEANVRFCPNCGTKLKEKNCCVECGAKLTTEAKFCPECGKKVE